LAPLTQTPEKTLLNVAAAERMGRLTYAIRNVAAAAANLEAEGRRIVYLNIGDPLLYDFETPPEMVEAVVEAMREGRNYYGPSQGITPAREAVAGALEREGVDVSPGNLFITSGATEGIELALTAMLEPGDNVLTPVPGYPLYSAVLTKLNVEERRYRLDPSSRWRPDLDQAQSLIDARTRAIVVINPNNPTGAVWGRDTLERVLDLARRHHLVVLADEVYHAFTYGPRPPRLAALAGDVPVIGLDSLSKAYLATGWRVGWLSLHGRSLLGDVKRALTRLADARLCGPTPPQFAIPVALAGPHPSIEFARERLRDRRAITVRRLASIPGFSCNEPEAAFYAMPRFEGLGGKTDEEFVLDLLKTENVLIVHGSGFGMPPHEGYMRIVYLPPPSVLEGAFAGIERAARRWLG
jgi:alanine-synthesizing transaminase